MDFKKDMQSIAKKAKDASLKLAVFGEKEKNAILSTMADLIVDNEGKIKEENLKDLKLAKERGITGAMLDRLTITPERISSMVEGLRTVINLPDPIGETLSHKTRPNGLEISKVRVPIGVICIIYESRPNVTVDSAGLCFKTGNSVILRGGKEAIHSNIVLVQILRKALKKHGAPEDCIQILETTDRSAVPVLLSLSEYIDLVIPRGGEALIKTVVEQSQIPVIKHYKGICHVYIDKEADLGKAEAIAINAKVQRPGVCNAMETLLVHEDIAKDVLVPMAVLLRKKYNVELRGCKKTKSIINDIKEVKEEDWHTEYLDLILSIKVVGSLGEAIEHINTYGSKHSDAIITENKDVAERFCAEVDSACLFINTSTRFSDGGQFGMGAEIGISTDKIHARGPMGLEELTSYKYIVRGNGQIRE